MRDRDDWVSDLSTSVPRGFFHRLCLHSHPKVFSSCTIFFLRTVLTILYVTHIRLVYTYWCILWNSTQLQCSFPFTVPIKIWCGSLGDVMCRSCAKIYTTCTSTYMVWIRTQKTRFHVCSFCLHIGKKSDMYQIYQISVKRSELDCLCKHEMFQAIILTKLFKNSILFYTLRPTLFNSRPMRVQQRPAWYYLISYYNLYFARLISIKP